jgi:hypothetical protein
MKTLNTKIIKNTIIGLSIVMMMASFGACSKKVVFLSSSVVPAAEGYVKVKKDGNENYAITLKVSNLAEVDKMQPPKKTYVVWMETDRGLTRNIGQLVSSRNLNANFETVSSFKPVKIFLTAEDKENVQYPGNVVLSTAKFWN